jgi:hypothetical protein
MSMKPETERSNWVQQDLFLDMPVPCEQEEREGAGLVSAVFSIACICIAAAELAVTLILLASRLS